jgi:hypothetical protein
MQKKHLGSLKAFQIPEAMKEAIAPLELAIIAEATNDFIAYLVHSIALETFHYKCSAKLFNVFNPRTPPPLPTHPHFLGLKQVV